MTFADRVIHFNQNLKVPKGLPPQIRMMNPFQESEEALRLSTSFYKKFYNDHQPRKLILGINPGRLGAGLTGIPFTDSHRLTDHCGITTEIRTFEPSAVFVYEMIAAYGGVQAFYRDCFFNSVCPLGFVKLDGKGKEKNFNYYDHKELEQQVKPYIAKSIKMLLSLQVDRSTVFCLGTGKNYHFLTKLNKEYRFFDTIVPLEHPRYIMQYKSKSKDLYIRKYIQALKE